ncbi:MAG TPA: tRNA 2-thiouridine(34) synthase MnmA [Candidatus Paceibacterota bacterium]|jgi:tRNA-specific 2-thiouridylase|nr:tRNA 2-thiouridine(34) synthase MnmA [Candidatus Paceibacterota bacterium]
MAKTAFVGLSGGVDSAVSAALLKERGYNVIGAFIKIWSPEFLECTWKEDRIDAMRACAALEIPFREVDLSDEYKNEVVGDMLENYSKGLTPNPDVVCNRSIKFGHFARFAFENGADAIATGHYARVIDRGGSFELLRGTDPNKDQSYFLYRLGQGDLSKIFFPVGEYTKPQVRELASKFGLPNARRPDSQGLCFVGDVTMKDFLSRFISLNEGDVIDGSGDVVGTHDGAMLYTIGERHGFKVLGPEAQYVVAIDVQTNVVRVSARREDATRTTSGVSDMHWTGEVPALPISLEVQTRYREKPFRATVGADGVTFDEPHIAAPGQSLVFYQGERCLGGGVIR